MNLIGDLCIGSLLWCAGDDGFPDKIGGLALCIITKVVKDLFYDALFKDPVQNGKLSNACVQLLVGDG